MSITPHTRSKAAPAVAALATLLALGVHSPLHAGDDPWPSVREAVFQSRPIAETTTSIQLFAPNQADDAALVPISVRIPAGVVPTAKTLTLIIDRNPAPIAATFTFGEAFRASPDVGERTLATRVRVDAFSRIRAVLERTDGSLEMTSRFVIGAGGCSAPSSKDPDAALANLGKTQLKVIKSPAHGEAWREVVVMIKHPNFTGLQMDKKTGRFTPSLFVNTIEVRQNGGTLLRVDGGISLSEDPNIRLTLGLADEKGLEFSATDTEGRSFYATARPDPS